MKAADASLILHPFPLDSKLFRRYPELRPVSCLCLVSFCRCRGTSGRVAEWLGTRLQICVHRFESGRDLFDVQRVVLTFPAVALAAGKAGTVN